MKEVILCDKTFGLYMSAAEIDQIVTELATKINARYADTADDIMLISILDGSFMFMADLVRKLDFQHIIHFIKIRSYRDMESSGEIEYVLDLDVSVTGKTVLVIEDIIDTGLTLESFIAKLQKDNPKSLDICTLLSKPEVHNDIVPIDFVGKEIDPEFIVGYGLDLNGYGRNLRDIYKLKV